MSDQILVVHIDLIRPEFHGHRSDGSVDWPPSPTRLIGALLAGAHALEDPEHTTLARSAITRICGAPPPTVHTPPHVALSLPGTYTQRTAFPDGLSHKVLRQYSDLSLFGLQNTGLQLKESDGVALLGTRISFAIDVEIPNREFDALLHSARAIGYFGTSRNHAGITMERRKASKHRMPEAGQREWILTPHSRGLIRGWLSRTVEWFDEAHERVFGIHGPDDPDLPPPGTQGFIQNLRAGIAVTSSRDIVVTLNRTIQNHHVPVLVKRLRSVVPADISLIPLVNTAHSQADGRCAGVILICPKGWKEPPYEVAQAVLTVMDETDLQRIQTGPVPSTTAQYTKVPTWTQPSCQWTSATPLRAYPHLRVLTHQVQQQLEAAYGVSVQLRANREPTQRWQHRWSGEQFSDGLAHWWLDIVTSAPIPGPLSLGTSIEHGFGLMRPTDSDRNGREQ